MLSISYTRRRLVALTAIGTVAIGIAGPGTTARSQSALWPDAEVQALWPTFASLSRGAAWNGVFHRCTLSQRVPLDYACKYRDPHGKTGYVCLAAHDPVLAIRPFAITARVAPGNATYSTAPPIQVCDSAFAYSLSLG